MTFKPSATATENVAAVLFGREGLTWGALWNLLHWLCLPDEAHGLGKGFRDQLTRFAFGQPVVVAGIEQEFRTDAPRGSGAGRYADLALWAPGLQTFEHLLLMDDIDRTRGRDAQKLKRLRAYLDDATRRFPNAKVRLVVLTDESEGSRLGALRQALTGYPEADGGQVAWKVLPVRETGRWISELVSQTSEGSHSFLGAFVEWTMNLGMETGDPRRPVPRA